MVIKHWLHSAVICLFFPSFPPLSLPLSKPALRFQLFMDWKRHITGRGSKSDCRNPDSLEFIGSISSWTRARHLDCAAPEVWTRCSPSRAKQTPQQPPLPPAHVGTVPRCLPWLWGLKEEKESSSMLLLQISYNQLKKKLIWLIYFSLSMKLLGFFATKLSLITLC